MDTMRRPAIRLALSALVGTALIAGASTATRAQSKAPIYIVIEVDKMLDADAFGKAVGGVGKLPAGARFLVRTNKVTPRDGDPAPSRLVIIEFPTPEAAKEWSDSVKAIDEVRLKATKSRSFMAEGLTN